MVSMTIRNLGNDIKQRLCIQTAEHGHLMKGACPVNCVSGQSYT